MFTIHIPIALASLLAPILGVEPDALMLLPLHVVLLELLIDPTCSIVLERQPAESDIMERKPRDPKEKLLNMQTLLKSVIQTYRFLPLSVHIIQCLLVIRLMHRLPVQWVLQLS